MLKLMKYEFKKTLFSKYVILAVTAVMQILFMVGVTTKKEDLIAWGIAGLTLSAVIGLFYIGIESILMMQQDLNTKQSYMLFLTPRTSYQILGAKILENGLAIFLTGVLFGVLAIADFTFVVVRMDGVKMLMDIIDQILKQVHMEITITRTEGFLGLFGGLSSWLSMIVNGYLAIVLSATFLSGKKLSGLVSFLFYMLLVYAEGKLITLLPDFSSLSTNLGAVVGTNFVMIILAYLVTGWIMEKKLSV